MKPDYATAAATVHPAAKLEAALGLVMHHAGRPSTVSESVSLLAACAKFAPDPESRAAKDIVQIVGDVLGPRGVPVPNPESIVAALYGAGEGRTVLASATETPAEPQNDREFTTAEVLRLWAQDADEAMREPLEQLADQCERELATAGQDVAADAARGAERSCLEVIASKLSEIKTRGHMNAPVVVEPETFAILAALEQLSTGVSYLVNGLEESADKLEAAGALACEYQRRADAAEKALHDARRHLEHLRLALHGGLVETQAQAA